MASNVLIFACPSILDCPQRMKTFNGLSFPRVTKWKKLESEKDRVMINNFFILILIIESFGISGIMEEVSTSSFF
jgi:hypothetical protein